MPDKTKKRIEVSGYSRREFLQLSKNVTIGLVGSGIFTHLLWTEYSIAAIPSSEGYILVDAKKCQGCLTCMMTCSLLHEGKINLSLSRIQIIQNPFGKFPSDLSISQCRQCVEPACVMACPVGALTVDPDHGNVRIIYPEQCVGCMQCINACPYKPGRAIWNAEGGHSQKCDLCTDTPYWDETGGPDGKQGCVEACPLNAIAFTKEIPVQEGQDGYTINLRGESWAALGYPTD